MLLERGKFPNLLFSIDCANNLYTKALSILDDNDDEGRSAAVGVSNVSGFLVNALLSRGLNENDIFYLLLTFGVGFVFLVRLVFTLSTLVDLIIFFVD